LISALDAEIMPMISTCCRPPSASAAKHILANYYKPSAMNVRWCDGAGAGFTDRTQKRCRRGAVAQRRIGRPGTPIHRLGWMHSYEVVQPMMITNAPGLTSPNALGAVPFQRRDAQEGAVGAGGAAPSPLEFGLRPLAVGA
jgi:hypothetical protein